MKLPLLLIALLLAGACAPTKSEAPPEAKAQVHGFPAEWLEDPAKHGLPEKPDQKSPATPVKGDPRP